MCLFTKTASPLERHTWASENYILCQKFSILRLESTQKFLHFISTLLTGLSLLPCPYFIPSSLPPRALAHIAYPRRRGGYIVESALHCRRTAREIMAEWAKRHLENWQMKIPGTMVFSFRVCVEIGFYWEQKRY